jgi:hypothetical protein
VQEADRATHGWPLPASAPTLSSGPGTPCAKLRCWPWRAGAALQAIHALQTAKSGDEKGSVSQRRLCRPGAARWGEDRDLVTGGCLLAIQLAHQREERRHQVSREGSKEEYSANVVTARANPLQYLHRGIMHADVTDGGGT